MTGSSSTNPAGFAAKWSGVTTGERAAAQEHFIDLCRMLGVPTPNEADPTGEWYAFEKGAGKLEGGEGFADVWKRGHFAWEYKGKKKDLRAAYRQLNDYREALENPPLLVVCDLDRFEVHTNFTGTPSRTHAFTLADLAADATEPLRILRAVMSDPEALRPDTSPELVTEEAARLFGALAQALSGRGHDPRHVAHFLDKLLFCLFAEDAKLLPKGLTERLIAGTRRDPALFTESLRDLFGKMSAKGGMFGADQVDWFNGGLFDGDDVVPLEAPDLKVIEQVAKLDWARIEPAIFGTLFERSLDPAQRTQLGAHYTDRESIRKLVEPVILAPLRREYEAMKADTAPLLLAGGRKPMKEAETRFRAFLDRLRSVTVIDPACGSGNFLYLALHGLKDLEWEAIQWGSLALRIPQEFPQVGPHQLKGLEINVYAAELARVTIWIGEIQWMLNHGLGYLRDPILRPLDNIREQDALLDLSDPENPREAEWPEADFIVGNPPFLGRSLLRGSLGDAYVEALWRVYDDRLPRTSDLCCYWHEKARAQIAAGRTTRAGLLATQGIRSSANRRVLERIKETGDIFLAWSDEPWVLAGAVVHLSFVGQDKGTETERMLNGLWVAEIHANLTSAQNLTRARRLGENAGIAYQGDTKGGPFEIDEETAHQLLASPNPDGRDNSAVVRPWVNAVNLVSARRREWIIDFGPNMSKNEAALYEAPYEHVRVHVEPVRRANKRAAYAERWWIHAEARPGMRHALQGLARYIATPRVGKHRIFSWLSGNTLADTRLAVFATDDDSVFGVLQSRVHEVWARATGSQRREVESGFAYNPTTCFETFPFPRPTHGQREAIAEAARELDRLRRGWLDPDGWSEADKKDRTLTNLYNQRPAWLADVHDRLDRAVFAAYGWPPDLADEELLGRLLDLNLARSGSGA
jgi:type II restriction/modification system DNA methylase subunit YeeA